MTETVAPASQAATLLATAAGTSGSTVDPLLVTPRASSSITSAESAAGATFQSTPIDLSKEGGKLGELPSTSTQGLHSSFTLSDTPVDKAKFMSQLRAAIDYKRTQPKVPPTPEVPPTPPNGVKVSVSKNGGTEDTVTLTGTPTALKELFADTKTEAKRSFWQIVFNVDAVAVGVGASIVGAEV